MLLLGMGMPRSHNPQLWRAAAVDTCRPELHSRRLLHVSVCVAQLLHASVCIAKLFHPSVCVAALFHVSVCVAKLLYVLCETASQVHAYACEPLITRNIRAIRRLIGY